MRCMRAQSYRSLALLALAGIAAAAAGCADTGPTTEPGAYDRGSAALKDPMNYSPDIPNTDMDPGNNNLDHKTLNKDWNDFLNP
jgi:hypothetical protein